MDKIAYVDTSVFLRPIIKERGALQSLSSFEHLYCSRLLKVEALRTLHRMLLERTLSEVEFTFCIETTLKTLNGFGIVPITESILKRAEEALPFSLGTLDGIHLATAVVLKESLERDILFLTHDQKLGNTARALGIRVDGIVL